MKVLSFDIEDWFHILDNPETALPENWRNFESRVEIGVRKILILLSGCNIKATFFCLGWIAEKHPQVIKLIHEEGHYIGTHGYYHQLVYNQTPEEFRTDLKKSIQILEDITNQKITSYRAPGFSITESSKWAFDILYEEGIKFDSSVFPAQRSHGGIANFNYAKPFRLITPKGKEIIEFPMNTETLFGRKFIFSGGGYFRLLPKKYLSFLFKKHNYIMTYFHPRDFDTSQPKIPGLNKIRKFKSNIGIRSSERKLKSILTSNNFISLSEVNVSDTLKYPRINI